MLILDTSVILNFIGTGRPKYLLSNLPYNVFAPDAVLDEVKREPNFADERDATLAELIEAGLIARIARSDEIDNLALSLAGAPSPDDLDDGEAYAIASAILANATIGIDERKGRRILAERWPNIVRRFTIDLIEAAALRAKLDTDKHADWVFAALQNARMRVPAERRAEIVNLIGRERAKLCPSLGIIF